MSELLVPSGAIQSTEYKFAARLTKQAWETDLSFEARLAVNKDAQDSSVDEGFSHKYPLKEQQGSVTQRQNPQLGLGKNLGTSLVVEPMSVKSDMNRPNLAWTEANRAQLNVTGPQSTVPVARSSTNIDTAFSHKAHMPITTAKYQLKELSIVAALNEHGAVEVIARDHRMGGSKQLGLLEKLKSTAALLGLKLARVWFNGRRMPF